ncbi:NlpC/P60 family protein [Leeuwenhoekiella marinoflava DSM 3653]|uniref:NlpC/P60 family protein n=3 Tax=Leeuwenhoekiella marinoflava TaxID=988 RepID=A0A4Q0PDT7_9FLAO|nr:NlpC/P60 family protein [Leeuwenhoekiella marinoflava]SHF91268.1 NlpC/P60 family protein [Leeuwenhoekiella marinoflava DSM 3653]
MMYMKRTLLSILASIALVSCGGSKKATKSVSSVENTRYTAPNENSSITTSVPSKRELIYLSEIKESEENRLRFNIINNARQYEGTPYKYGGITEKGMDCSGLVYTSFLEEGISIPRVSRHIAEEGKRIKSDDVIPGDLLFFITGRRSKQINHVGLVVDVLPDQILFIHSSTSQGVIVSSLNEGYWNNAFKEARRIM